MSRRWAPRSRWVAGPFHVYGLSHSALVGLLGAFELGPMIVASLFGGAIADRMDRRKVLLVAQLGIITAASLLGVITLATRPPALVILVLGGLLAGCASLDAVPARRSFRGWSRPGGCGPRWPSTMAPTSWLESSDQRSAGL